jgi:hypothetical protein
MPDSGLIRERRIGFIGGSLRFFGRSFGFFSGCGG